MPIGVPRIIYCWGEELPAQWTDIYNFIFRRRMVFLMQYLDDELCNQICGLLINIHMEDRSKEMEQKSMEKSGLFKSSTKPSLSQQKPNDINEQGTSAIGNKKISSQRTDKSVEDLLISEEDLAIDENYKLEQYTLQKITMEWLNWNAQFFDYSNEPYLFYLAEILSKDFNKDKGSLLYDTGNKARGLHEERLSLMKMFKNMTNSTVQNAANSGHFDVYSPFRLLANFASQDYSVQDLNPLAVSGGLHKNPGSGHNEAYNVYQKLKYIGKNFSNKASASLPQSSINQEFHKLLSLQQNLAHKEFSNKIQTHQNQSESSEKALGQRHLKRHYREDRISKQFNNNSGLDYLDFNSYEGTSNNQNYNDYREYYRKQTERTLQEEESKKVFVIINSFGGSVGNGITVHDALQFIKAGSLTLGLGVAASAASLALAGGTIGERYVTEGCHVMIHQPEGGLNGQASDIWIDSQEILKIRLDVAEIYSLSTYRPRHKILRDLDRDFYLTATETISYGLADEIATNEVMHEIIEMTSKVWDYHDSKQQRLLESRESASAGVDSDTSARRD
nr:proteolytic subunit 2 of clp protease [Chlorosarcina stigmatica]